jgi:hypothetical protein
MSFKKIVKDSTVLVAATDAAVVSEKKDVPPSKMMGADLTKLKSFKTFRASAKRSIFYDNFIRDGKNVLNTYDNDEELHYAYEIVQFIMQIAEDSFIKYKKQGSEKKVAVIEIVKKYFDDNDELVGKVVEQLMSHIRKSNILTRNKTRIKNGLLILLSFFISTPDQN